MVITKSHMGAVEINASVGWSCGSSEEGYPAHLGMECSGWMRRQTKHGDRGMPGEGAAWAKARGDKQPGVWGDLPPVLCCLRQGELTEAGCRARQLRGLERQPCAWTLLQAGREPQKGGAVVIETLH